jgi:hypothetical protein
MRKVNVHDITMAMIGPPALLACGISAIVGVFLTWVIVPLYGNLGLPLAGWRLIKWARSLPLPPGESFPEPYLVLAGGGLMALCGALMVVDMIPAVKAYLADRRVKWVRIAVAIGACAGAAVTAVGIIWFIPHMLGLGQEGTLGIGFYLALVAAALGLVFAVSMSASYWQNSLKGVNALYKRLKDDYNSPT